ncbi:restriction endonuclease subunit S [Pseudoxanthomonas sp.]|jgi:Restriction endonuclease S subunits|uniref:restriction endonuclease subunit S n=1 Tax=Pseudoxanthomonas sp. TaxID=1871049 RepID=UPI002FE224C0
MKLADCCDFYSGGTPEKGKIEFWNGQIPWFSPKDIKSFDLSSSQDQISDEAIEGSAARLVAAGTVLVVGRSGVLAHTLPVGIARQNSSFNQDIKALVPKASFDSEFLALFLRAQQNFVLRHGVKRGPTVHSLIAGFLDELEVPEYPLPKQRQIATSLKAQLSEVEVATRAAKEQLRELRLLRSRVVDSTFDKFEVTQPIAATAKLQSGFAFKSEDFQLSGTRLLRNTNILPGKVYWDDVVHLDEVEARRYRNYSLARGDILVSLDRPLISSGIKVARVSGTDLPALLVQRVGRFLMKKEFIDADFLWAFLHSSRFIAGISGHDQSLGVPHVSPAQVEAIEIPLLPIDVQKEVALKLKEALAETDAIHQAAIAQLAEIERLPQKLLAQAFPPQGDVK